MLNSRIFCPRVCGGSIIELLAGPVYKTCFLSECNNTTFKKTLFLSLVMNYIKKLVWGTGIILLFSILAGVMSYALRIVLARELGPAEYGLFYSVFTFIIFFLFFRDWGLGAAIVKYLAEFKVQEQYAEIRTAIISVFLVQVAGSLIFATIIFFAADTLALHYFQDPRSVPLLQIFLLYLLFSILFITVKQAFLGLQETAIYGSFEFVKNGLTLALVFFFLRWGLGIFAPALAYTLASLLLFVLYLPAFLRRVPFFRQPLVPILPLTLKLASFGLPVLATTMGGKVIGYIDTLFLTYFRTLGEVGVYNAILPSALVLLDLGTTLATLLLPLSSELWAKGEHLRLEQGLRALHRFLFALVLPVLLTVFVFADLLIGLLFGEGYRSGSLAFQILLIGVLFCIVASVNNSILSGIGQPAKVTKIVLLAAGVNVMVNVLLIPRYGISGAALATSVSYLILLILSTASLARQFRISFPWREWSKLSGAGLIFLLIVLGTKRLLILNPWWELLVSFIVGTIIYGLVLVATKTIVPAEVKRYFRLVMSP